ncbi:hypothetical protein [Streptomyces sp. KL116D]|uniref:hypothetical protein n=1 Tax=Streptomyces sp. KL116D TaxID=3045152 RepID=UPI003555EC9A
MEQMTQEVVEFIVGAAGGAAQDLASQGLVNLVSGRLAASGPDRAGALPALRNDPSNSRLRQEVASFIEAEAESDATFATQLRDAHSAAMAQRTGNQPSGAFSFGNNNSGADARIVGGDYMEKGAARAGRDITNKKVNKFGGAGWPVWVLIAALVGGGAAAGGYYTLSDSGPRNSAIGADPGESGARETWSAAQNAISHADSSGYCALLTPEYKEKIRQAQGMDCVAASKSQWNSTDSGSLRQVGGATVKDVKVIGSLAEVTAVSAEGTDPAYIYMARYGDRWRLTETLAYAAFHPEDCPEVNWSNFSTRNDMCDATSLL